MEHFCYWCMSEKQSDTDVCPVCGKSNHEVETAAHHLVPGTILRGRYVLGRVLGHGGFGVTYIGLDLKLQMKIAVKEYLPNEFSTRAQGAVTVSVYSGEASNQFNAGLNSFLEESRKLAKFNDVKGITYVQDVFAENGTSYIAMEFLEGITLKEKLQQDGPMLYEEVEPIFASVLDTLDEVHQSGIIHRDISPDNIFLTTSGEVKLLDFGAARYASSYHSKSLSVILKQGYAPEEQYRSRGNQGPWSDVYGVAATLYKMITGITPQDAMDRLANDKLLEPSKAGAKIAKSKENAIMNALNITQETRTATASKFKEDLLSSNDVLRVRVIKEKEKDKKALLAIRALMLCVPFVIALVVLLVFGGDAKMVNLDYTNVPNVLNEDETIAREMIEEAELYMVVAGTTTIDYGDSGKVQYTTPAAGDLIKKYDTVSVLLSANETVFMPNVEYWNIDVAVEMMESAGLNVKYVYVEDASFAEDTVIAQEFPEGEPLSKNYLVELQIAVGAPAEQDEVVSMIDLSLLTYEQAIEAVEALGLYIQITSGVYDELEYGTVLSQNIVAGDAVNVGAVIYVEISLGKEKFYMPDLYLQSQEEVELTLASYELQIEYVYQIDNNYEEDLVLGQSVEVGGVVEKGDSITITLSKIEYGTVPSVLDMSETQATKSLEDAGFSVVVSEEVVYSYKDVGTIVEQSVVGEYPLGRVVTIYTSAGLSNESSAVPDIVGMDQITAEYTIKSAQFSCTFSGTAYSDTIPEGYVVSYSPSGTQQLGSMIYITISLGVETKTVPDVIGQSSASAKSTLEDTGFVCVVSGSEYSSTIAEGCVVRYSPSGDQKKGTTIYLVTSLGIETKEVPNVTGQDSATAKYNLEVAGFNCSVSGSEYSDTVAEGNVISYSPSGIQAVGTTINLVISLGKAAQAVPNVVSESESSAKSSLSAIGMSVSVTYEHSESYAYGTVISQSVSAGTMVMQGTGITIAVSRGTSGTWVSTSDIANYPESQYTRTATYEYQYTTTTYETTTRTSSSATASDLGDGWSSYNTTSEWSDWTTWTGSSAPVSSSVLDVKTTTTYSTITYYNMVSYMTMWSSYRRYGSSSFAGNSNYQSTYGEFYRTLTASESELSAATKVSSGGYYSNSSSGGYNESSSTGYVLYHAATGYYLIFFPVSSYQSTEGATGVTTYQTRTLTYTHYYERYVTYTSDWSDSSSTPSASSTVTVTTDSRLSGYYVTGIL